MKIDKNTNDILREAAIRNPPADQLNMAKMGLIALIDEATGYQQVRPKDALQQELERLEHET